jgi:hypothetical protein
MSGDLGDVSNVAPSVGVVKTRLKPLTCSEDLLVSTAESRQPLSLAIRRQAARTMLPRSANNAHQLAQHPATALANDPPRRNVAHRRGRVRTGLGR